MVDVLTIYIGITVVFSVLLFIIAITGGIFDVGPDVGGVDIGGTDLGDIGTTIGADAGQFSGAGISPLSLPILFAFGAFFGAFGTVLESFQSLASIVVPFVAALASMAVTGLVYYFLVRVFARSQVTTTYVLKDLIGSRGEITVPAKPGSRGQVLVITEARGRTLLSAVSSQELSTGDRVQVTGVEGNALVVEKA